jgi:hypothetical protein
MKTAAIIIDAWKLSVFDKHLTEAGYSYTKHEGVAADTLTLRVAYAWVAKLQPVVEAAQAECGHIAAIQNGTA